MRKLPPIRLTSLTIVLASPASGPTLGVFAGDTDVGNPKMAGNATYEAALQRYVVTGSGYNVRFNHDEFHFLWKRLPGDFTVRGRAHFIGEGGDSDSKLGRMVRSDLDSNATHVSAVVHGDGLTALRWRRSVGGETEEARSSVAGADETQLERRGHGCMIR